MNFSQWMSTVPFPSSDIKKFKAPSSSKHFKYKQKCAVICKKGWLEWLSVSLFFPSAIVIANNAFLFLAASTRNVPEKKIYVWIHLNLPNKQPCQPCLFSSALSSWYWTFCLNHYSTCLCSWAGHNISIRYQAHADETYKVLKDFLHLTAKKTPKVIYWAAEKIFLNSSSYLAMTLHVHDPR